MQVIFMVNLLLEIGKEKQKINEWNVEYSSEPKLLQAALRRKQAAAQTQQKAKQSNVAKPKPPAIKPPSKVTVSLACLNQLTLG